MGAIPVHVGPDASRLTDIIRIQGALSKGAAIGTDEDRMKSKMKKIRHYITYLTAFLLLLLWCSAAWGRNLERLIQEGDRYFNRGDYQRAMISYQEAYARVDHALPLSAEIMNNVAAVNMAENNIQAFHKNFALAKNAKQRFAGRTSHSDGNDNMLMNGGFEEGLIYPWGTGHYERTDGKFRFGLWWNSNNAKALMKIDRAEKHSGQKSLRITNYSPHAPHVFTTLSQRISDLEPNTVYRISLHAKAKELTRGAVVFSVDAAWAKRLLPLPPGTYDWRPFSAVVNIGHNDCIDFRIIHQNKGSVWLDDIVVEKVRAFKEEDLFQRAESLFDSADYEKALNITLELEKKHQNNKGLLARARMQAGKIYVVLGKYAQALDRFHWAVNNGFQKANIELGELYYSLGNYEMAAEYFKKSAKIVIGDQGTLSLVLNKLSRCYLAKGELDNALATQHHSFRILKHIEDKHGQSLSLTQLGVIYQRKRDYTKALNQFSAALELARKLEDRKLSSDILIHVAETAYLNGRPGAAQESAWEALQTKEFIQDQLGLVSVLYVLCLLHHQNQPGAAIVFGKQAINILQGLRAGISKMDAYLQQSFLKKKAHIYETLADLLIDQGRLPEAQQVLAMLKEEEYFDFIRRDSKKGDVRTTKAAYTAKEQPWRDRYKRIRYEIVEIGKERENLKQKKKQGLSQKEQARYAQLEKDLKAARKRFKTYLSELMEALGQASKERYAEVKGKRLDKPRKLQQALKELGHSVVAIHYLITKDKLRIILTTPDVQLARDSAIASKDLNRKIHAYRQTLQRPTQNPLPRAKALYRIVLGPIEKDLAQAGAKTLMISLDGTLRYLPVAALHDGRQYVAEKYALALYTAAAGLDIKDRPSETWRVAGLGLSKAVGGLDPLPSVPEELEGIVQKDRSDPDGVLPGVIRLNETFTQKAMESVLTEDYPVLHIASHFQFRPGTEQNSHLVLGDGAPLTLAQIKEDDYDFGGVELLTLSACNTAVGGAKANGSEVESFGALAQDQGAKGVLATLWPVADKSTGLFMQSLYRIRQEQKLTKAEALQEAQVMFIRGDGLSAKGRVDTKRARVIHTDKKSPEKSRFTPDPKAPYSHPYYWAPFILMGNWL
jgi:CHAT domain-containing protein/tetratricopeptide (TPR) repeat protein